MDHVVHINDGSAKAEAKPIVLRLIPGEEMTFRLNVVNHGKPSNISLEASSRIIEAVHSDGQEHHVAGEETIPVTIRMPDIDRLEGELILIDDGGKSSVPITLIKDSESEGDGESNSSWGEMMEFTNDEEIEERAEKVDDGDAEDLEVFEASEDSAAEDIEDEQEESSRIKFSKDKDLERYRASRRHRGLADHRATDYGDLRGNAQAQTEEASSYEYADSIEVKDEDAADDAEDMAPGFDERANEGARSRLLDLSGDKSTLLAVPSIMLVALIALLVLTFYSESIPEFSGALASSMLIVTLIIYGAATLLKA